MGDATMAMLGTDSFSMSYQDGTVLFKRGEDKKVNKIVIIVSGTNLEGKKDSATGTAVRRNEGAYMEKALAVR